MVRRNVARKAMWIEVLSVNASDSENVLSAMPVSIIRAMARKNCLLHVSTRVALVMTNKCENLLFDSAFI